MGIVGMDGMWGWFKFTNPTACALLELVGEFELLCLNAWVLFLRVIPGVLSKNISHMCGRLNLTMFLFRLQLLTLTNMDSFIFLAKQPYLLKLNLFIETTHILGLKIQSKQKT